MSLLTQLNPVQSQAASVINGPVIIVAGAGSGKTRVLTFRIAHLLERGIKPYEILALTFTNKAAKEMKERITTLVGPHASSIWAGTFHSIFARILRQECELLGYQRTFSIYDTEDSLGLIKNIMSGFNISTQQLAPRTVLGRISGAKNQMVKPAEFDQLAKEYIAQQVSQIYFEYQKKLKNNNAMDFDDLLINPIELFQRHPHVLEKYQYRFQYLLVDEYQDTNRAQYVLIKMLAERFKNICVVGDDAQSIYAFRGADIRNILDFERDYPESKIFRLEQNYRSTKIILSAADSVIKNNKGQIKKTLWTDNSQGEHITLIEAEDDKNEGSAVVQNIQQECTKNKYDMKHFAILYRTNAQSRSLEDALRRASIPYVIVGGVEFYKRKEIKDVLAYLRVIVNSKDEESLLRIINFPTRGIGDTTIEKIHEYVVKEKISLLEGFHLCGEIVSLSDRTKNNIRQFILFINKYQELKQTISVSELARAMVDELGILKMFKDEGTAESIARWENVQELLDALTEFVANNPEATLESFLEEVSLVAATDRMVDNRNAVTLMTLHAAKGLEFPVVFIAGMEEGLFPLYQVTPDTSALEEERRLFYVGITRAMKKLYLTHARIRYRFGDVTYPVLSRFVEEIDSTLLVRETSRQFASHTSQTGSSYSQSVKNFSMYEKRKKAAASKFLTPEFASDDHVTNEIESQENLQLKVGALVEHEVFGKGKITGLSGRGEAAKAVVYFQSVGAKHLMLQFAKLRIVKN